MFGQDFKCTDVPWLDDMWKRKTFVVLLSDSQNFIYTRVGQKKLTIFL